MSKKVNPHIKRLTRARDALVRMDAAAATAREARNTMILAALQDESEHRLTERQVAEHAGVSYGYVGRLWRARGERAWEGRRERGRPAAT